jgi:hypothetical protein
VSNVAFLRLTNDHPGAASQPFLGPAEVTRVTGPAEVEVRLPGGAIAAARLALAFGYEPCPGDVLLVIGNPDGHYVIGVLHGTGKATMAVQGDVELRAVGGELVLSGDKGVRVEGAAVEVRAGKLSMIAETLAQKLVTLRQHVTELVSLRAGKAHTIVDETVFQQSKRATILTEETVTVNGKAIHLG